MYRNLIFTFILFATFSIINAVPQFRKRETPFYRCAVGDLLTVKVSPDPLVSEQPATYTVSGTLSNDITAGKTILEIVYDEPEQYLEEPFIQILTDSYKAGTPFNTTAKDVPTPKFPDSYFIGVMIADPTDDPKQPLDVYGCAFSVY
jgi:protein involved in polysaccharide export with SLBB domain